MKLIDKARQIFKKEDNYDLLYHKQKIEQEILCWARNKYTECSYRIHFCYFDMISEWLTSEGIKITNEKLEADEDQMITLQLYWGEDE